MPPLPALQVRVPNPANALLQAEQILGAREQRNALARQTRQQEQIAQQFAGGIPGDPAGRNALAGQIAAINPQQGLAFQQAFNQLNAADQAQVAREGQQVARALIGVNSQAGYDQARASLSPQLAERLPPQYQPQLVQSLIQSAQSIDSLIAQRQPGAGFVLSPGQTRFNAAGEVVASLPAAPSVPSLQDQFKNANTLRDEFVKQTDSFAEAQLGLGRVRVGAELNTGQGDVALIFGFMKTIDPESTVREGEFATAEQTSGIADRALVSLYNRVVTGERLTPQQRQGFVEAAEAQFGETLRGYEQTAQEYTRLAEAFGLDPANVVVNRVLAGQSAAQATPVVPTGASVAPDATVITTGDIQPNPANMPRPTTQEGYDALPNGAWYIDPDSGQPIRKGR